MRAWPFVTLKSGDAERASQTLELAPPDKVNDPELASVRAAIALDAKTGDVGETAELRAKLETNPKDHQTRFDLALALNGAGDREGALSASCSRLSAVDRAWNEEAARKQLLEFFDAYGPTDDVTKDGRKRLSSILFS